MTVRPDAPIAGAAPRHACIIASSRLFVVVQFLAVAADEQQRIVRPRAEHQNEQDALALPVERQDVVLRQLVDDQRGRAEREDGAEHREEPEHRAAVHHQQDER